MIREILWTICRLLPHAVALADYIKLRSAYERALLSDNWGVTKTTLTEIENRFGSSIWLIQNKISSAHLSDSTIDPSVVADEIAHTLPQDSLLRWMIYYIRRRIEGAVLRDTLIQRMDESLSSTGHSFGRYARAKIFDITTSSDETVANLLYFDAFASVIDQYDGLILAMQAVASDQVLDDDLASVVASGLRRLYTGTGDERIPSVVRALGVPLIQNSVGCKRSIERAKVIELYSNGRYLDVIDAAETYLSSNIEDMPIHVINVKARVAAESCPQSPSGNKIIDRICTHLHSVLNAEGDIYNSTHAILTIADRYLGTLPIDYLRMVLLYEIGSESEKNPPIWLRDIYVRDPWVTPFSAISATAAAKEVLVKHPLLQVLFPITTQLLSSGVGPGEGLGFDARRLRLDARGQLGVGEYATAAVSYGKAALLSNGATRVRCLGGAALATLMLGRVREAVDMLVNAHLASPNVPTLLPAESFLKILTEPNNWPNTINLSLLFELAGAYISEIDVTRLRLAFERFQLDNNVTSPSDLASRVNEFGRQSCIAYLDKVWRPEFMKQTLLYASLSSIEDARIDVCSVLAQLDFTNSQRHLDEMTARVKQQEISKLTREVEQSKVYVDIGAIRRTLINKLAKSYLQYKSAQSQSEKQVDQITKFSESIAAADISIQTLSELLPSLHVLGNPASQVDIQFDAIFSEVTKEFLRGDHGLNAYLSTRIRHGKLVDALRKPVMDEHLVTQKGSDGVYAQNTFWLLSDEYDEAASRRVTKALAEFSSAYDNFLISTRDTSIQITIIDDLSSLGERSGALFAYQSSRLERKVMQIYDRQFEKFEDFIGKCVDVLWNKTDSNLLVVRNHLTVVVRAQLMTAFDALQREISSACGGRLPGRLSNAIVKARTATQASMDAVVGWFNRSEVYDRADYKIDTPAHVALNIIMRTTAIAKNWIGPSITIVETDGDLPGRTLDGLVDVFSIIFENAIKHSSSSGHDLEVSVHLTFKNGAFRGIFSSNASKPTEGDVARLAGIRETLATAESRKLAQNEGKSGFRKVWLALDNPIYREPSLDFQHGPDGRFITQIAFKTDWSFV